MLLVARPKGKKTRRTVSYRLPEDLLAQLDLLTDDTRRTATAELELALESHLKKAKLWPPEKPNESQIK
jgi:predicted transcriptional regulator